MQHLKLSHSMGPEHYFGLSFEKKKSESVSHSVIINSLIHRLCYVWETEPQKG